MCFGIISYDVSTNTLTYYIMKINIFMCNLMMTTVLIYCVLYDVDYNEWSNVNKIS